MSPPLESNHLQMSDFGVLSIDTSSQEAYRSMFEQRLKQFGGHLPAEYISQLVNEQFPPVPPEITLRIMHDTLFLIR